MVKRTNEIAINCKELGYYDRQLYSITSNRWYFSETDTAERKVQKMRRREVKKLQNKNDKS